MRIVAGQWRGHHLFVPDTADTRPTMDRTRQAVFNILGSAAWALTDDGVSLLSGAAVLDVFAGSGAMGFEALSQGAASCVFFENHPLAITAIEKNQQKLKAGTRAKLIKGNAAKAPVNAGQAAQIAFFDPPYKQGLLQPALVSLKEKKWLDAGTLLVLEMQKREELEMDLVLHDERIYGTSKIIFAQFS